MRIGIFTEVYYPYVSGVVSSIMTLKRGLEKSGHEVFIITTTTDDIKFKIEDDGHLIRLPGIKSEVAGIRIAAPVHHKALRYLKKCKLDIVHTQTEFGVGLFGKMVAKKLNIPIVHTFHTLYDQSNSIDYITKGFFPELSLKILQKYINGFFTPNILKVIAPSEKTKDSLRNFYKIRNDITIIPSGIDLNNFYKENYLISDIRNMKQKLGISSNDFVLLYVGRLGQEKNIEFLIENLKEIIKKNKNVKLLIVGGEGKYLESLMELAKSLNIENNVIFTGKVPHENIAFYYQLGDLFVTASTFETQGLTVNEALAASLPVLAIRDRSFESVVIDTYNGAIFDDDKSYVDKVLYYSGNSKKLRLMRLNARQIIEKYSVDNFAQKIVEIYDEVIKNK